MNMSQALKDWLFLNFVIISLKFLHPLYFSVLEKFLQLQQETLDNVPNGHQSTQAEHKSSSSERRVEVLIQQTLNIMLG